MPFGLKVQVTRPLAPSVEQMSLRAWTNCSFAVGERFIWAAEACTSSAKLFSPEVSVTSHFQSAESVPVTVQAGVASSSLLCVACTVCTLPWASVNV